VCVCVCVCVCIFVCVSVCVANRASAPQNQVRLSLPALLVAQYLPCDCLQICHSVNMENAHTMSSNFASAGLNVCAPLITTPQIGFFKVIVRPLVKAWVEVFPCCAPLLEQVYPILARSSTNTTYPKLGNSKTN
jgi:hypothetical protein